MPPAPSAAKIAAENRIDLAGVAGSGKRGQVLKGDVLAAVAAAAPLLRPPSSRPPPRLPPPPRRPRAATPDDSAREERVRMTKLRQTIARRLKDAQNTAAMLTTFNEVDMTEVMAMRARYKDAFEKKHGAKLGFMGFFVKACVQALKEIPAVNAEIDGADLVYKNYYHLGIAVGTDKGLIVPVVRDCDKLSVAGIEQAIADLGRRARDGQLKLEELQGGTFTITNGGIYGSLMSTPILNAPQSGILGMHKIQERPVVVAGKDRDPPDDVSGAELRPPRRRRQGGGDLPRARQGGARRSGAAGARPLIGVAPSADADREGSRERTDVSGAERPAVGRPRAVQAGAGQSALPLAYLLSSRDKPACGTGPHLRSREAGARATTSRTSPPSSRSTSPSSHSISPAGIWPTVWIVARIVYLPLYLFNVIYVRSIVWGVSLVAILMMLARLAGF